MDWNDYQSTIKKYYQIDEDVSDQIYALETPNIPERLHYNTQIQVYKSTVPNTLPIGEPLIDSLYHHRLGPSLANITEICGPRSAGKTFYCLQLAKKLLECNLEAKVLWIQTRVDFDFSRLRELDIDMSRIYLEKAYIPAELFMALNKTGYYPEIRMIVIDSIVNPFLNYPQHAELLQIFGQKLRWLCGCLPAFGIVTNYCYEDAWMPPIFGDLWSWAIDQRVNLYRKGTGRFAYLSKCFNTRDGCSPNQKLISFEICDSGIHNCKACK